MEKINSKLKPLATSYQTLTDATSETLQKAIMDGIFPPDTQLPPEFELVQQLGISRSTLREALKRLEEQGLISRKRGLGTYVRERSIIKDLSINFGISEMIRESGQQPGTVWIDFSIKLAPVEILKKLMLPDGSQIISIERVRTANKKPVVVSIDFLPANLFGEKRIDQETLGNQSLYTFLWDEMQIRVISGLAKITPIAATQNLATKLNVKKGTPLLKISQVDFSVNEKPIIFAVEYHLPDAFVFLVNRKGPHW